MKNFKVGDKEQPVPEGKSWFSWTNDGPNANVNSLQVLLDWMTIPGNYNRFTGGTGQRGETKQTVAVEIQNKIKAAGIVVNRSTDSIIHKIKELVSSYKAAHQVKHQTGQSTEAVYATCKYFDALDPILGSRPSTKPLLTNKDIIDGKIFRNTSVPVHESSTTSSIQSVDSDDVAQSTVLTKTSATISSTKGKSDHVAAKGKSDHPATKGKSDHAAAKGKSQKLINSVKVLYFVYCVCIIFLFI